MKFAAGTANRRRTALLAATVVVACGALLWFAKSLVFPSAPCNVLLVTMDTTRADRLGCYGYDKAHTPVLDQLAQSGTLFTRAYTVVALTQPAHTSLLTGLLPPEHGIRVNGKNRLSTAIPTMATELADKGYDTAAFIAAVVLGSQYGLDRGFDLYDDTIDAPRHEPALLADTGMEPTPPVPASRSAELVVDSALQWLTDRKASAEPFFCWVHFYDPHFPYERHSEVPAASDGEAYDSEIAYMDLHIGRLLKFLDERGIADNTLVIAAGDHGEGLHDHGEPTHGSMVYDSTIQIPLIMSWPGHIPTGRRLADPVSIVDVFPTVLDILHMDPGIIARDVPAATAEAAGRGRSLLPTLRGDPLPLRKCYAESMHPLTEFGWAPIWTVITKNWKFMRTRQPELYNLQADAEETTNLVDKRADIAAMMNEGLGLLAAAWQSPDARSVELSAEQQRLLASLGYVGSGETTDHTPTGFLSDQELQQLRDIKQMWPVCLDIEKVRTRTYHGDSGDEVLALCRDAIARSPETTSLHYYLGNIMTMRREFEGAVSAYSDLLRERPDHINGQNNLGLALIYLGRYDEALTHVTNAIRLDPSHAMAHNNYGVILAAQGKYAEAVDEHAVALALLPTSHLVHKDMGNALSKSGRVDDAVRHYETSLKLRDGWPLAARPLAWLLATHPDDSVRQPDRARQLAWTACEATRHQDPACLDALAAAYAASGRYDKARDNAATAIRLAEEAGDDDLARGIRGRLDLYTSEQPFRDATFHAETPAGADDPD